MPNTLKYVRYRLTQTPPGQFLKYRILPLLKLPRYLNAFGLRKGLAFPLSLLFGRGVVAISFPGIKSPILMRLGTSDVLTFQKIFFKREYDLPLDIHPYLIIDAGANVGYASLFFANKYPDAEIIAIEPEDSNFKMLQRNSSSYPRITSLHGALWSKNAFLRISNLKVNDKWTFQVGETESGSEGTIESFTVEQILKESGLDTIDILKMDVEGAEKEILVKDASRWMKCVKVMIVELHDHVVPGCKEALHRATENIYFETFQMGENLVLVRK